jgi:hypothetical protein
LVCVSAAKREAVMIKPTMAAVIGLVCVFAVFAGTGGLGVSGTEGGERDTTVPIEAGAIEADSLVGEGPYTRVPASHAAYGWRYPSVFLRETSLIEQRPSAHRVP